MPAFPFTIRPRLPQLLRPLLLSTGLLFATLASAYDPLALPAGFSPQVVDTSFSDSARSRELPVRFYLPTKPSLAPVVIFSHGLGGSRSGSSYLGRHWAGRGYVAVFIQHPGSDSSVWQDKAAAGRMAAMRRAASADNLRLRIDDVKALLDQLARWNRSPGQFAGRFDLARVGMSGHSFGALTTQALAGARYLGGRFTLADPRLRAAIVFSPSAPRRGDPGEAFGQVALPWLLMTGTEDLSPIGNIDLAARLAVYPALPPGGKYELVLAGAQHSAFTDHALPGERGERNPAHHRAILALSTAFWDAWLQQDAAARRWLDGDDARRVLQSADRWQRK